MAENGTAQRFEGRLRYRIFNTMCGTVYWIGGRDYVWSYVKEALL
jgi:hypothetical protein